MITNDWLKAAEMYKLENERLSLQAIEQKREEEAKKQREKEEAKKKQEEIYLGMGKLSAFLEEYGSDAMALLRASRRHIVLGESRDGGGFSVVYLINGDGLHQCVESTGMSTAFGAGSNPRPIPTRINVQQAIEAAVNHGGKKATEVVDWLMSELNKIAQAAPK